VCGIVAATSYRDVSSELFEMLRRLDYRGYDSSGISIFGPIGSFEFRKKQGNLEQLARAINDCPLSGNSGIGHTRWATHGVPSDLNAHPHFSKTGRVAIVHNGIIENYREIYKELQLANVTPTSETDSEVIAHLVEEFIKSDAETDPQQLVQYLVSKIKGAFAIAIQLLDKPEQIIGIRYQCPLNFIQLPGFSAMSSDIASLVKYTGRIGVLRDGQAIVIRPNGVEVFGFDGSKSDPVYVTVDWSVEEATKSGYPHYLRKEIDEEPGAILSLIKSVRSSEGELRRYMQATDFNKLVFLACGSASFSGTFGSILGRHWQLPTEVISDIGSEFRYKPSNLNEKTLLVAVSQSGETADTLGAVDHAVEASSGLISFVNVVGSSLDRRSNLSVRLAAGSEIAVPSSKAVVNQFLATTLIACLLRENSKASIDLWQSNSEKVAASIASIISMEKTWLDAAGKFSGHQSCFALGRGLDYPIALEMALKLKETAYIHGEAMYAGEFKHGSISLIEYGMPVFCFLGDHSVRQKTISNIEEIKARGAQPFIIDASPDDSTSLSHLGAHFRLPYLEEPWSCISQLAVIHLLAYHAGLIREVNVDRPRNLAKSVTVE
jgi:glutamine---fructose-6-phosphate transaminase (isomerizing)